MDKYKLIISGLICFFMCGCQVMITKDSESQLDYQKASQKAVQSNNSNNNVLPIIPPYAFFKHREDGCACHRW